MLANISGIFAVEFISLFPLHLFVMFRISGAAQKLTENGTNRFKNVDKIISILPSMLVRKVGKSMSQFAYR